MENFPIFWAISLFLFILFLCLNFLNWKNRVKLIDAGTLVTILLLEKAVSILKNIIEKKNKNDRRGGVIAFKKINITICFGCCCFFLSVL